jgi:hypothetical protein
MAHPNVSMGDPWLPVAKGPLERLGVAPPPPAPLGAMAVYNSSPNLSPVAFLAFLLPPAPSRPLGPVGACP